MRKPLVSVIIPTLNEARFLPQCLESIKRQTYKNIEIIVVDNHSTDKTVKIAKKFGAWVYTAGPERAGQVNFGVKKAKGKYCYRVDGDFLLEPEIVEQCVKKCEEENLDGVAVHNTSAEGLGFWADVRKMERNCYRDDDLIVAVRFFSKKAFEKIGGFDTDLFGPEDYDFHNRFLSAGFKFGRVKAIERHLGEPKSLRDIFRKSFVYGQEMGRYLRKNPRKAIRQLNPARLAFFRHFKELVSHPLLFFGFIVMGIVKSIGGWLGIIKAFVTGFKRKYQVVKKSYA